MKLNYTVRRGALEGVEAFLATARNRSFRKAASELGVTASAVSQAVRSLEARVGTALLFRTTRSVGLTEAGERFLALAEPAFEGLLEAFDAARYLAQRPAGLLRLSVPKAVVPLLLEPVFASFCSAYPEIELEIDTSDQLVDLAAKGFDAGIRLGELIAPDMVAVRLTPAFQYLVVASPLYLERHGIPQRPEDLKDHACLRLRRSGGAIATWKFIEGARTLEAIVSGPLITQDYSTLVGAAVQGLGLAQVPAPLAASAIAEGTLLPVLAEFATTTPGLFLYHLGKRQVLPKLRAFIDHVKLVGQAPRTGQSLAAP
ncbi:MAG TPA: LysR family transcriptional regulator [Sphingomicrobium sp.]|jgi:DNA-binding transcriptional LysR family regulator|nr:LysR family transcriptional regulator [Sphingomicrobium sp.]